MSLWGREPYLALRVLGAEGIYPSFEIRSATHVFIATPALVWTAVVQQPLPHEWERGEVVSLVPEEVRLLSAISLCERNPWDKPRAAVTHLAHDHIPSWDGRIDLTDPNTFELVQDKARSLAPPNLAYTVRHLGSRNDALAILERIDTDDQLLLAGLARFLGGKRLATAHNEREEAVISLFVAMGAGLEFVRLHLSYQVGRDASFEDVHEYLRRALPHGEHLGDFFAAQYEERIVATHPSNRLGEFWAPPIMADDLYDLEKALIVLFRHIILDEGEECMHAN